MNFDLSADESSPPEGALSPGALPSDEGAVVELTQDGGLVKRIETAGHGPLPDAESVVRVHYVARVGGEEGAVFDTTEELGGEGLEFTLSTGAVVVGLELAVRSMRPGERASISCQPQYGYGAAGRPPEVGPHAALHFGVHLVSFRDREKQPWEMGVVENFEAASAARERGNALVQGGEHGAAATEYVDAVAHLDAVLEVAPPSWRTMAEGHGPGPDAEALEGGEANPLSPSSCLDSLDVDAWRRLLTASLLNLALCQLKLGAPAEAEEACTRALAFDAESLKARLRRGRARAEQGDTRGALTDLEAARTLDPGNRSVARELRRLEARRRDERQREVQVAQAMFSTAPGAGPGAAPRADEAPLRANGRPPQRSHASSPSEGEANPNSPAPEPCGSEGGSSPRPSPAAPPHAADVSPLQPVASALPPRAYSSRGVLLRRRPPPRPPLSGARAGDSGRRGADSPREVRCCGSRCCRWCCRHAVRLSNPLWWLRLYAKLAVAVARRIPGLGPAVAAWAGER